MRSKHIVFAVLALGLTMLAMIGCSAVTQAPELHIVRVNPAATVADSAVITVTFRNMNKVDAIITNSRYNFRGLSGMSQSPIYTHSVYVSGDVDSTAVVFNVTGLTSVRTLLGSPVTMWMKFWGTDAYGYGKAFTTDSVAINCN